MDYAQNVEEYFNLFLTITFFDLIFYFFILYIITKISKRLLGLEIETASVQGFNLNLVPYFVTFLLYIGIVELVEMTGLISETITLLLVGVLSLIGLIIFISWIKELLSNSLYMASAESRVKKMNENHERDGKQIEVRINEKGIKSAIKSHFDSNSKSYNQLIVDFAVFIQFPWLAYVLYSNSTFLITTLISACFLVIVILPMAKEIWKLIFERSIFNIQQCFIQINRNN